MLSPHFGNHVRSPSRPSYALLTSTQLQVGDCERRNFEAQAVLLTSWHRGAQHDPVQGWRTASHFLQSTLGRVRVRLGCSREAWRSPCSLLGARKPRKLPNDVSTAIPDLPLADSVSSSGRHYYAFPFVLISDYTNAGHAWNVAANHWGFWYSAAKGFVAVTGTDASVAYLNFAGKWGDQQYPDDDSRQ